MNDLSGKIALITGATSGIGEACAKRFAQAGATVVVAGRNEERGAKVVAEITANGNNAVFKQLDVCQDASIQNCADYISEHFRNLDVLVNCAGAFPMPSIFENITRESIAQLFDVNVSGLIMTTSKILPLMRKGGSVINIASVAGLENYASGKTYAYSASKAAIIKFTKQLAKQYATKIRVNAIAPGIIKTPIFQHFDEERYASMVPMGRVGMPEDVAKVANFLASDDAAYMTGAVLVVDGGQSL